MDYKDLQIIYNQNSKNLELLLNNNSFILLCKENSSLSSVVLNQISIINYLETEMMNTNNEDFNKNKELGNFQKSDFLFKIYKEKINNVESLKKQNFKKMEEIKDALNYLEIFLRNTYKKDINSFLYQNSGTKTSTTEKVKAEKMNSNTYSNNTTGNNFFNQNPFGAGFNQSSDDLGSYKESYIYSAAQQKLNKDILTGTFYKYKTKPKSIILMKKIIGSLFTIIALIGIISVILTWLYRDLKIPNPNNKNEQVELYASTSLTFETINTMFYTAIYVWVIKKLFQNEKNENFKYTLPKMLLVMFTILFSLQLIYSINFFARFGFNLINEMKNIPTNEAWKISTYQANVYLMIIQSCTSFIIIISVAIALYLSPKIDLERINEKLRQYSEEIRAQI